MLNLFFSDIGTYYFTAFTNQKDTGVTFSVDFDGTKVLPTKKSILELNPILDKTVEVEKTITFKVSITDNSVKYPIL